MKESFWGVLIVFIGLAGVFLVYMFQDITNTDEHNYNLLKETTEGAMIDAVDLASFRESGIIRIDREKFVENFLRRFADTASLSTTYSISFYGVYEAPPKVSVEIRSKSNVFNVAGDATDVEMVERIDTIIEGNPIDSKTGNILKNANGGITQKKYYSEEIEIIETDNKITSVLKIFSKIITKIVKSSSSKQQMK